MIVIASTPRRSRDREREHAKRDRGECFSCSRPASPGHIRCEKCMAKRRASRRGGLCQRCNDVEPLPMGLYCGERCRWLARCEEPSTEPECDGLILVDLEPAERAAYSKLLEERINGQRMMFKGTHFTRSVPLELPEYSRRVFAESLHWEG